MLAATLSLLFLLAVGSLAERGQEETRAEAILRGKALFGVYYRKSAEQPAAGYLVDHTTLIYLIDQDGQLRYLSQLQDSPEVLEGLVRKVLAEG